MRGDVLHGHVPMVGFAIFLVINASQAWGGVFPFLPMSFQTDSVTLIFYLCQALAFFATFLASTFGSYLVPGATRHMMVGIVTALVFAGSASIIAAMYVLAYVMLFVVLGGVAMGVGCAGMFMLWQRYFASVPPQDGNLRLAVGTGLSAVLYFALHLIPTALTAFLVPLVLLPLSSLCLTLSIREMSIDQPMFEDVPREHPNVYRRVMADSWRGALAIGAVAFASGLARGVALLSPDLNAIVNIASMLGSLVAAVVIIFVWRAFTVRFSVDSVFRMAFPVVFTSLLFFPFVRSALALNLFAGVAYMAFSMIVIVMMMQSAQLSRDRGINPVFSYGLFGSVAYGVQSVGFLLGWLLYDGILPGVGSVKFLSLLALYVLGMALFASNRILARGPQAGAHDGMVELIRLQAPANTRSRQSPALASGSAGSGEAKAFGASIAAAQAGEGTGSEIAQQAQQQRRAHDRKRRKRQRDDGRTITDRLSKQCFILQDRYGLTNRETEVMEAIARGLSMANIAETLFISENTVRTHSKHIYSKLDIHSRQELGAMLQDVEPDFRQ